MNESKGNMAERISDEIIQKVQEQNDIIEVISTYIQLKKAGRNFKALCPFHSEKTPSFYVNPDKQIFHCFGCGVGGNIFSFLMKYSRMSFGEAVRFLAEKKGIEVPKDFFISRQTSDLARAVLKVNEMATLFFEQSLRETREGQIGLAYLQKRQIKRETIDKMRLGYAPLKWDGLCLEAVRKQLPLPLLEKAGLISPRKEEKGYYDYFRKRIIFPIFNLSGQVIGFGGRVLDDDAQPKYLNSPETPVFSKGDILYGLNFAKENIQRNGKAIVVEGYLDFISLNQAGIENVVASSGTSLTEGQVQLLKRFAKETILVYDPDIAGEAATLRGIELLLRHQLRVGVVSLKDGLDPDEYVRLNGKDSFLSAVNKAKGFFEYNLERLLNIHGAETIQEKIAVVEGMLPWIKLVENSIERREMVKQMSERLALEESDVLEEFNKFSQKRKLDVYSPVTNPKYKLSAESSLIKLLLENEEIRARVRRSIEPKDFFDTNLRQIAELLWSYDDKNKFPSIQSLINFFPEEENRDLFTFLILNKTVFRDEEKAAKDCIEHIKKRNRYRRQKELEKELRLAEAKGETETVERLLIEYQNLVKSGEG